jgi:hypothetical protein
MMRQHSRLFSLALLAVLGFSISCDRDCPTAPPLPEDKGYNFYVLMRSAGPLGADPNVLIYNTKQRKQVDSIPMIYRVDYMDIEVAPDESYLVLATSGTAPYHVAIIDLATRQPIWVRALFRADAEISPNGRYIALQGDSLCWYLDGKTFETVAIDSGASHDGAWDSTGNVFYSIRGRSGLNYIRRFDLATMSPLPEIPYVNSATPGGYVAGIQPTTDSNKVYLFVYYYDGYTRVISYNFSDSSIGFSYYISSPLTKLAITPDWKTLLFSDPSTFFGTAGSRSIYFVNIEKEILETIIPPSRPNTPQGTVLLNPYGIAVSADGKYAMVSTSITPWIGMISLKERKYVDFFRPDTTYSAEPFDVACRAKPN